jgi:hypothetical protein
MSNLMAIFALLAIRLSSTIVPHAANGRFKAMISCDPVPGFGRLAHRRAGGTEGRGRAARRSRAKRACLSQAGVLGYTDPWSTVCNKSSRGC